MRKFFKRNVLWIFLLALSCTLSSMALFAQPDDSGDPGDDPDKIPLDPGTWVLVAAGVGYGVKKWKEAKTTKNADERDITDINL
ncbi:MAG: hypothetical protein JST21_08655 [Bacteroidetes bacterium]|nr:hypothetical protein [Bacteroidota bacterium]